MMVGQFENRLDSRCEDHLKPRKGDREVLWTESAYNNKYKELHRNEVLFLQALRNLSSEDTKDHHCEWAVSPERKIRRDLVVLVDSGFNVPPTQKDYMETWKKAQNLQMCEIPDELKQELKKFRLRKEKNTAAILLKIDTTAMTVNVEERYEDCTVDELREELPERQPRFVVLSYVRKHSDGRVSYPLILIYLCPRGCKTELSMMYAGTRNSLKNQLNFTKEFELRDLDDFTTEWLEEKLEFFR